MAMQVEDTETIGAIDLSDEALISLKEATKLKALCRDGRSPHVASLYRWAAPFGCRGVRLETIRVGATLCTSEQAVLRFLERLNDPSDPTPSTRARQTKQSKLQREVTAHG